MQTTVASRQAGNVFGDVQPLSAAIAAQVDQAVIAAGPQQPLFGGRFGEREDGAVHFRPVLSPVIGPPDHFTWRDRCASSRD